MVGTKKDKGTVNKTGRVSETTENYLSSIYKLIEEGEKTTPAQIAEYIKQLPKAEGLGTSLPSVIAMLRRLEKEGLVHFSATKETELTAKGNTLAEDIVRRHRLAECMVVSLLGVELHLACVEGHRLEHAITPNLQRKIQGVLGNPTTCPFGGPIPGSGYQPPAMGSTTLALGSVGPNYVVIRVPEEDPALLQFLVDRKVLPGAKLNIVDAGRYRGVPVFTTNDEEIAIGYKVAERIRISLIG